MWREYAGDGCGFVIEFNAQHEFFGYAADGKSSALLRQEFYRDARLEEFWRNPNYLFLVKETKYAFEKEWRMIKSLSDCAKRALPDGKTIYLVDIHAKLIRSVIFGPRFPTDLITECEALLRAFDGDIAVSRSSL
jgi:hypothetical protein